MPRIAWIAALVAGLGLSACGGGTPAAVDGPALATVRGAVVSRDGSTLALDGVVVSCPDTSTTVETDAVGSFELHVPLDRSFRLDFDDPMWPGAGGHDGGPGEPRDPVGDRTEVDGDEVAVGPMGPDEWCEIEVHIDGGEIVECHVRWGHGGDETHEGESPMDRDPLCPELGAAGEVEFTLEGGCLTLEVEIGGFSAPASLDVYLVNGAGEEAFLATMEIDGEGTGHVERTWCADDPLPFGVTSPADLAGYGVVVYDESGAVVFRAHIPHHPGDEAHPHHGPGEDGGGPHHGPGEDGGGPHGR